MSCLLRHRVPIQYKRARGSSRRLGIHDRSIRIPHHLPTQMCPLVPRRVMAPLAMVPIGHGRPAYRWGHSAPWTQTPQSA